VTLGELQAIPSIPPHYVFRLAILTNPHESPDPPAVTVRHPHTALSLVKQNVLELRLRSLTEVEFEVSHGGQTLNRLLTKRELQGAHARLEAAAAWSHYQAANADQAPHQQMAALLDAAYQAHQTWRQFDPTAAQQALAQVLKERQRLPMVSTKPADSVVPGSSPLARPLPAGHLPDSGADDLSKRATVEREMRAIREEMTNLTSRVTPWDDVRAPAFFPHGREARSLRWLFLGGALLVGLTSFLAGVALQRRSSAQAMQRRRVRLATERRGRQALMASNPRHALGEWHRPAGAMQAVRRPTAVIKRLRVSQRTTQRIRLRRPSSPRKRTPRQLVRRIEISHRSLPARPLTPAALIEALEHLRYDLMNRQRLVPPSDLPEYVDAHSEEHTH
jgi:hypothetical protein